MVWPEPAPTVNVRAVEPIDPKPADADQRRWRIAVDDGTIPGSVEVYMSASNATAMEAREADPAGWIAGQVKSSVRDVPGGPPEQLSALRALGAVELRWIV